MKRVIFIITTAILSVMLCSCSSLEWQSPSRKSLLEIELSKSIRIVFTNNKETALKFTVADPSVIGQISNIIGRSKTVAGVPGADPDYSIKFYFPDSKQIGFDYWMGATENNKEINIKDGKGTYHRISDSLDTYIINSTKMFLRPNNFAALYSKCLSEAISLLEKNKSGDTVVGVNLKSDRRMRKYTMSYEEDKLYKGIKADGFIILPYDEKGEFTYEVDFITDTYNPDKADITIEVSKILDKTMQYFEFKPALVNGTWVTNRVIPGNSGN